MGGEPRAWIFGAGDLRPVPLMTGGAEHS
jgi:hypothetical protein